MNCNTGGEFADVDVVCPRCGTKARFRSQWNTSYKRNPRDQGFLSCLRCGLSKDYHLKDLKYYYAIEVGGRYLVARTKDNLQQIYNYFSEGRKLYDEPDLDYPKVFYVNKDKLLQKIQNILMNDKS